MSLHAVQVKGRFYILKDIGLLKRSSQHMAAMIQNNGQKNALSNWI